MSHPLSTRLRQNAHVMREAADMIDRFTESTDEQKTEHDLRTEIIAKAMWESDHDGTWPKDAEIGPEPTVATLYRHNARAALTAMGLGDRTANETVFSPRQLKELDRVALKEKKE